MYFIFPLTEVIFVSILLAEGCDFLKIAYKNKILTDSSKYLMMILKLLLITIVLMAAITVLFAIRILIQKGGKFPNTHIGENRNMAKRGIHCANTQLRMASKDKRHILKDTLR